MEFTLLAHSSVKSSLFVHKFKYIYTRTQALAL